MTTLEVRQVSLSYGILAACSLAAVLVLGRASQRRFVQQLRRLLPWRQERITVSKLLSRQAPYHHAAFSSESVQRAANFQPRATDVFILTAPKTGTTFLQQLCHALRTGGAIGNFEDIYQVVPWDQMAWDLGQELDAEQVANPRLFKSHLQLSSVNPGARYICVVRDVEDTLLSWWRFLREKDVPPLRKYASASEFVFNRAFVVDGMRFGATIWQYYVEFYRCLGASDVLVLCYEDLEADLESHLDLIASFLGCPRPSPEQRRHILELCSRSGMAAMGSRFDESWAYKELRRLGRCPEDAESFKPAPRVRIGGSGERLNEKAKAFLKQQWHAEVFLRTGLPDYAALQDKIRSRVRELM